MIHSMTVLIVSFLTDGPGQTAQIRLLLEGLHCFSGINWTVNKIVETFFLDLQVNEMTCIMHM